MQLQIHAARHTINGTVLGKQTESVQQQHHRCRTDHRHSSANCMCAAGIKYGLNYSHCNGISRHDNGSTELELTLDADICLFAGESKVCGSLHAH